MIQHMNNTLVKHNKVFFTILLVIIVIGFVMFFGAMDPTSFLGAILGGSRNNLGKVFDKEDVTINDINEIRKKASLLAFVNPNFANSINADNLFYLSAFEKAARLNGVSVSDKELQEAIAAMPIFAGENGFDPAKYKEFTDGIAKNYQATASEFEEAFRMYLTILKFQMTAADGVSVSDNELNNALDTLSRTATFRTIRFSNKNFEKGLTVSDEEVKEYYNKNKEPYMESTALVVYLNANSMKDIKIDAKQIEDAKKSDLYKDKKDAEIVSILTRNAAMDAAAKKIADFRNGLIKVYESKEFTKDPAAYIKAKAAAEGLEVTLAEGLTVKSPATPILDSDAIFALCRLAKLNTFTQVMKNGDSSMIAVLVKRGEPSAEKLAKTVYPEIKGIRLAGKMRDAAFAKAKEFSDAAKDGKITVDNLEAEAKKYGAALDPEKAETVLTDLNTNLAMFENLSAQSKEMMDGLTANAVRNVAPLLQMPMPGVNFCSAPYLAQTNDAVEIRFCVKCVQTTGIAVSPFVRNVVKEAVLLNKQQMATVNFSKWIDKNVLRYMTEEEKQQMQAEQQGSAGE